MSDASTTFGIRLKTLRKERGLSQTALANRLGVTEATVRHWEHDRNRPSRKRREVLASALGVREQILTEGSSASFVHKIDTIEDMEEFALKLLAEARMVRSIRLSMNYAQPAEVQRRFKQEQVRRLREGSVSIEKIEIFHVPDRIRDAIYNLNHYRGLKYRIRYFCTPPQPIPILNFYAFDMSNFIVGGYHVTHPPVGSQELWLSGDIWSRFLNNYWTTLWQHSLPLSELDDPIRELKSIATAIGIDEKRWDVLCIDAENIGQRAAPPQP